MAKHSDRLTVALLLSCLVSATGCGAATRRSMGSTVMAIGALTDLASVYGMVGGCTKRATAGLPDATGERACIEHADPDRTGAAMVFTAGLTAVVVGGILFASGVLEPPPPAGFSK